MPSTPRAVLAAQNSVHGPRRVRGSDGPGGEAAGPPELSCRYGRWHGSEAWASAGLMEAAVVEAIGELYHRYERGLENQLGALGLVLNCAKDDRLARCVVEDGWPPARAAERMSP